MFILKLILILMFLLILILMFFIDIDFNFYFDIDVDSCKVHPPADSSSCCQKVVKESGFFPQILTTEEKEEGEMWEFQVFNG